MNQFYTYLEKVMTLVRLDIFMAMNCKMFSLIILGEGCSGPDGNGFCFLEFVTNPDNPSENCFPDAQFSKSHGRFWSNMACAPPPLLY